MANLVSLNQTIVDVQRNFKNLLQKTYALIQKYNNAYGEEDGRAEFFVQYFLLNLWLLIQFDSFLEVFGRRSNRVSRYIQFTPEDAIQFKSQYNTINRTSYCTKAMFDVEHFFEKYRQASRDEYRGRLSGDDKEIEKFIESYRLSIGHFEWPRSCKEFSS